jgi:hypothetical protein
VAFDATFQPLKFRNLTLKSRDAMVAQIMSVFNPPPFV